VFDTLPMADPVHIVRSSHDVRSPHGDVPFVLSAFYQKREERRAIPRVGL
jgi:hypothetical protein